MPKRKNHYLGEIIGNNTIIEEDIEKTKEKNHGVYWKIKCNKCGEIRSVRADNLQSNCHCCMRPNSPKYFKDNLIGKKFGYWIVISKAPKDNYWHCKCQACGTERDVFRGNLTQNLSKSCGCIKSWGETQISYWLNYYKINFQKEYIFSDLKTDKNGFLRFDFAIIDNNKLLFLIEYDGRQHYTYDQNWNMSIQDFELLQKYDKLKTEYCIKNNIPLYRLNKNSNIKADIKNLITLYNIGEINE